MRLRAAAALGRRETVEIQEWGTESQFPSRIVVDSPPDYQRVAAARHGADRWLTHRGRGCGSGMCLAVTQWLDRTLLLPRDKQRGIRCGDLRDLPGAPGLGPAPGERLSVHGHRRLHGAINRVTADAVGPGQRFAIAAMEVCDRETTR